MYTLTALENELVEAGRKLMDLAWNEKDDVTANRMSRLGTKLVTIGSPFGTKQKDITAEEWTLIKIAQSAKKEVDILV